VIQVVLERARALGGQSGGYGLIHSGSSMCAYVVIDSFLFKFVKNGANVYKGRC
jgi:hypothetical protein